jgi:hypothetical protein
MVVECDADGLRGQENGALWSKRGEGAYWGYKWEAKKESNRIRRENAKREIRDASATDNECETTAPIEPRSDFEECVADAT